MARFLTLLALLTVTLCAVASGPAQAQSVAGKILCEGSPADGPCNQMTGTPERGEPVYYQFTLYGGASPVSLPITEDFPASFALLDPGSPIICTVSAGPGIGGAVPVTFAANSQPLQFTADLASGQDAVCTMAGAFTTVGGTAVNTVSTPGSSDSETTVISSDTRFDADIEITKELILPVVKPLNISGSPQRAKYRITVTTDELIYLGDFFRVYDQLALFPNGVSVTANLLPGSTCSLQSSGALANCVLASSYSGDIMSSGWSDFASWGISTGSVVALNPGDALIVEYEVEYSVPSDTGCVKADDAEGVRNRAFLGLAGSSQALRDDDDGNNDTDGDDSSDLPLITGVYNLDPDCNAAPPPGPASTLQLDKITTSSGVQSWVGTAKYVLTLSNPDPATEIFDVEIKDVLENQPGTPNFRARLIRAAWTACAPSSSTCVQTSPNPPTFPGTAGPLQSFTSYYDRKTIWNGTVDKVASDQIRIDLQIYLHSIDCDYAPLVGPKTIRNWVEVHHKMRSIDPVSGQMTVTNHVKRDYVDITVATPPQCKVSVTKTAKAGAIGGTYHRPDHIVFGQWRHYDLTFSSLPAQQGHSDTIKIGTLIDAVRIASPFYATGLSVTYQWDCTDTSGGGVRGFQTSGSGNATVNHVGAPHQGVRVMSHPGIVEFDPGASLRCSVRLKVDPPLQSDPYCFSDGQPMFENLALMDGSRYFNANMVWPHAPQGTSWDSAKDKLPVCRNLIVNKDVAPGVVGPNGGPVTYTVRITNANLPGTNGDIDIPANLGGEKSPWFIDQFLSDQSNGIAKPVNSPVYPASNPCAASGAQPCDITNTIIPGVTQYNITKLAAQDTLTINYTLDGPFLPHEFCNSIQGSREGSKEFPTDIYAKFPDTWRARACVLVRGSLEVNKRVITPPWINFSPATQFSIDVECDTPSGFSDINRTLAVSSANSSSSITRIPIGSTCEIEEVDFPDADQWGECEWRDPVYTAGDTILVDGSADPHRLDVLNQLDCEAPEGGELTILKELVSPQDCPTINAFCTFRITVSNNSSAPVSGPIEITDVFSNTLTPSGYYYAPSMGNALPAPWVCSQPNGGNQPVGCIADPITLMPGQSTSFEITFDMPNAGTNCALLETPLQSPKPESCVDVGTVEVADLSIVKTKITSGVCHGAVIQGQPNPNHCTFEIVITNNGSSDYNGPITLIDEVTPNFNVPLISSSSGWTCNSSGAITTCDTANASIPAGGSITLVLVLHINSPLPAANNCVTLNSPVTPNGGPKPKSCAAIGGSNPQGAPELTLTKTKITTETCTLGAQTCHFRFDIENTGTGNFAGSLTFEDQFLNGTGYSNLSIQSISPSAWNCMLAQTTWTCTNPGVSIPQGSTHTVDIIFDYGPGFSARLNCARLVQGAAKGPDSCTSIGGMRIQKEVISQPDCAVTGSRQCTFRITLSNSWAGMHTGPVTITDAVDFGGVPQNTPVVGGPTNGWSCSVGSGGVGLDCSHPGPIFPSSGVASFEITLDLSAIPPVHIGNCAEIAQPAQQTRQRSCVQLGPIWEPPQRRADPNDLPREKRKMLEEAANAAREKIGDVRKKSGGFKLPKLPKVRINIGGIRIGGSKRNRDGEEKREEPKEEPKRDPAGNPIGE